MSRPSSARPGRPRRSDRVRAGAVLAGALLQIVAGGLGGSGTVGTGIGQVASSATTPIMPASAAFSIWGPIYAALLALAVRQLLPGQLARGVNRATGWWLAGSSLLNAAWILVFSSQLVALSQVVIVALLVVLAVVLARLSARPAEGTADRLLLHGPVALYTGWVSLATVVGFATTGADAGVDSSGALGVVLGTLVLLVTGAIASAVVGRTGGALFYAAAVVWALLFVAAAGPAWPVVLAALVAVAAVVVTLVRRVAVAPRRTRVAAALG